MAGLMMPKAAKDLLKRGFHIFPTRPGKKAFYRLQWSKEATQDPQKVSAWALSKEYKGCNWGVATGPSGLVVLDIDGPEGEESLADLELLYGELPETLVCRTASGGRHLYFAGKAKTTTSVGFKNSKIDSRSVGGMAFAPGSIIGEGSYQWELDVPIVECPEWLIKVIGEAKLRELKEPKILAEDAEEDIIRAKQWIGTQDPAVEGAGGETHTFHIMQLLRDMGLSIEMSAKIAHESDWNSRCDPPWEYDELLVKAKNAAAYSCGDQGSKSLVVDFRDELDDEDDPEDEGTFVLDPLMVEMNRVHSKQAQGQKVVVWCLEHGETGSHWAPYATSEFDKIYEHRKKEVSAGDKGSRTVPLGRWWREHPRHMRSKGVILDPEKPSGPTGIDKPFNLWCGWGIRPTKGGDGPGAKAYQKLVVEGLSGGVTNYAEYVFDWCALLVQQPTVLPKVALVFRGEKGSGKSTLGLGLCDAFGSHAIKVDSVKGVTGQFNWHLKNKVFLLAEEIKWLSEGSGGEGVLKSLITDHHKGYEAKGINMINGLNYLSVMVNSNAEWVVPTSIQDERRFAVFDVSSILKPQTAFWDTIYAGRTGRLQREPLADFLGWLRVRDIRGFDPIRDVPITQALIDQGLESLDFMEKWWFDKIESGFLPGTGEEWPESSINEILVPTDLVYTDYRGVIPQKYARSRHSLGKRLSRFGVDRVRRRDEDGGRQYYYLLPARYKARAIFLNTSREDEDED